jgi:hypothetical protein
MNHAPQTLARAHPELQAGVDLYWLPLGAGGHSVRLNGRVYEVVAARLAHRPTCDLYHSALVVRIPEGRFVIEQAPVRDANGAERGVVAEGPVGSRWAGQMRIFRYELRAGEMWNSNSMIAWLIARTGLDADGIKPPAGGRAPGWNAGLVVARRP